MLSYIEISKTKLLHNLALFKRLAPTAQVAALIKANAYGHGQNEVAQILAEQVAYLAVDDLQELRLLRQVTQRPALVLGYVTQKTLAEAVELGAELAIYDVERLANLEKLGQVKQQTISVHIKIDACLGRQGILLNELSEFLKELKQAKWVKVAGVYTHFANIEDTGDFSHAQKQIDTFKQALDEFRQSGFPDFATHLSASSGILMYEYFHGGKSTLIRPGIGLYGMWPSEDLRQRFAKPTFQLQPVLRWVSHLAQVKTVPADYSIGYGLTYVTKKPTKIAIVPQGYSDGYDRGFSNCGEVLVQGTRCPVLGRVAMNMFAINVSHLENVAAEEEVVLLGRQGTEEITAEELAAKIGTINYEITTRISPLLPRVIT